MNEKVIFHVDVNSAFLSWEAVYRMKVLGEEEDLRTIPSAVGGDRKERKGVILAKSELAKSYGVQTGETIASALRKCPELVLVEPRHKLYKEYSSSLINILNEYTPYVEQYSIDEAFMDMTGTEGLHGDLVQAAYRIKDRVYEELGFTVNIGISSNKLLAKMAGDFKKPNLVHTLFKDEIEEKMWPLGVRRLIFVGKAAEQKLHKLGIYTIGDLAKTDPKILRLHLNKQGEVIWHYARGEDYSLVQHEKAPLKGYSNATTTPCDLLTLEDAEPVLLALCENVCARLRADKVKASCITVSVVDCFFEHKTHQKTLLSATHGTSEVYSYSKEILAELWRQKTPLRQLGVHATKLTDGTTHQYNIFDGDKFEKREKLDAAIDSIRNKFGEGAVKRAVFIRGQYNEEKDKNK